AILALGDSSYERFCEAGKRLDRRFEALEAQRIQPRVDCDIDYEQTATEWSASVLERLSSERSAQSATPALALAAAPAAVADPAAGAQVDKTRPAYVPVLENLV